MTEGWFPDLARAGVKYQAIADALGSAIEQGSLRMGDRLPPQRELAARLGVDLTTITKAYDSVRQRGLIEARGRAGSFVRATPAVAAGELAQADVGMNMPPELPAGLLGRAIAETSALLLRDGSPLRLHYQPAGGALPDRRAAAAFLRRSGLDAADPERLRITAGGQNALHAILSATLAPGDAVACADHVYSGFKALAARLGLRLVPLPNLDADTLAAACAMISIKALYVVPTNDNPTTRTLSHAERRAIAAAIERHDLQLIEDDAYGALAAEPLPPIAGLIPDRSWYIASTSKLISPALRVAFLHCPSIADALRIAADIHETTVMAPPLNVAIVTQWLADGTWERLIGAMRAEAEHRRALAERTLAGLDYRIHPQGYHLWLTLGDGIRPGDLAEAMRPTGLSVIAADRFAAGENVARAVRVSLGGMLSDAQLEHGLRLLHGHATAGLRGGALV